MKYTPTKIGKHSYQFSHPEFSCVTCHTVTWSDRGAESSVCWMLAANPEVWCWLCKAHLGMEGVMRIYR